MIVFPTRVWLRHFDNTWSSRPLNDKDHKRRSMIVAKLENGVAINDADIPRVEEAE